MTAPIRAVRVVDDGTTAVLVSFDPADCMVEVTAREVSVTLSPREADALAMNLTEAAEAVADLTEPLDLDTGAGL